MLLGAGQQAVADLGITTIADAFRPEVTDVTVLPGLPGLPGLDGEQPNVRLTMTPREGKR
jgi:diaminohydroxyphosphoribosylaminopyrimidine deaminase/5-amino-6-(5-phosphoribosylamino)uracil reductase